MSSQLQNVGLAMDARMLVAEGGTGVGSYARGLRQAQAMLTATPLLLSDRAALNAPAQLGRARRWLRALPPGARVARRMGDGLLVAPDIFRVAQVHFDLYRRLLPVRVAGPPGIMHWTYPVPLRLVGWHNLYTVHDVIPLIRPDLTPIDPARHRRLLAAVAAVSRRVVTVSEAARSDILATLNLPPERVVDCGQAAEPRPAPTSDLPRGTEAGRYLLVVGSVEPRKNIARILRAYAASGVALPLVIAGPDGIEAGTLAAAIAATPNVIRLPYLADEAMRATIGHARALLMPSLAEGFGLPVAEAMALGVPVITAKEGALAEVAGGAALAVDPLDEAALAAAIRRIAADDALAARLVEAGRVNARRFTLARFAERLGALYGDVIAQSAAPAYPHGAAFKATP